MKGFAIDEVNETMVYVRLTTSMVGADVRDFASRRGISFAEQERSVESAAQADVLEVPLVAERNGRRRDGG